MCEHCSVPCKVVTKPSDARTGIFSVLGMKILFAMKSVKNILAGPIAILLPGSLALN